MHMLALFLDDNSINPQLGPGILAAFAGIYLLFILIAVIVVIIPTWFICKKAGFSPWLSLLIVVPFGALVLLYVVAFSEWKVTPASSQIAAWQPPPPPAPPQV
jgi:intracellular septation protein A